MSVTELTSERTKNDLSQMNLFHSCPAAGGDPLSSEQAPAVIRRIDETVPEVPSRNDTGTS